MSSRAASAATASSSSLRARHREARRERGPQASVRRAMPLLVQRETLLESAHAILLQPRRRVGRGVHQAFADGRADAGFRERFQHRFRFVHRLHRQHRRGAGAEQFGDREPRRCAQRVGRVRRFERPDAALQPIEQREIVGAAAKQRLAQMDVRLHESRQEIALRGVDDDRIAGGVAVSRCAVGRCRCRRVSRRRRSGRPCTSTPPPSTTSQRSFIVRMVALRMRRLTSGL